METRILPLCCMLAALTCRAVVAQSSQPATPDAPVLVQLTIRPAAAPAPALKYRLWPDVLDQTPGDAVQLYDMAVMDVSWNVSDEVWKNIQTWKDMSPGQLPRENVRQTLDPYRNALRHAEQAGRRERCDWDLPVRGEPFDLLPSLASMRAVAKIVLVQARLQIAEGQLDEALHTLQTGLVMARRISQGPNIVHAVVGDAVAAEMLGAIPDFIAAPGSANLYWALTNLPSPLIDVRTGLRYEADAVFLSYPQLLEVGTAQWKSQQWQVLLDKLADMAGPLVFLESNETPGANPKEFNRADMAAWVKQAFPKSKQYLISQGRTAIDIEAMPAEQVVICCSLDRYMYWRDEMCKWVGVPFWQADQPLRQTEAALAASTKDLAEGWPFTLLLKYLTMACRQSAMVDQQIAALRCIEAIRMHAAAHGGALPASLGEITAVPIPMDPIRGKSFGYQVMDGKAVLDVPAPPGQPLRWGKRYELTLAK